MDFKTEYGIPSSVLLCKFFSGEALFHGAKGGRGRINCLIGKQGGSIGHVHNHLAFDSILELRHRKG